MTAPYTTAPKFCWENCSSHNILLNGEVILNVSNKAEAEAVVGYLNKLYNNHLQHTFKRQIIR